MDVRVCIMEDLVVISAQRQLIILLSYSHAVP